MVGVDYNIVADCESLDAFNTLGLDPYVANITTFHTQSVQNMQNTQNLVIAHKAAIIRLHPSQSINKSPQNNRHRYAKRPHGPHA